MNASDALWFIYGFLAIAAVFSLISLAFMLNGRHRRKPLAEIAESWGWSFDPKLPADLERRLQDAFLMKVGCNTTLHNALIHRGENLTHVIFEVQHNRGKYSRGASPEMFSVLLVEGFRRKLPAFLWRASVPGEGTWQARFFNYEPPPSGLPAIESPAIPNEFRLFGEPAEALQQCFSEAIVAYLRQRPELIVESIDSCLLFYNLDYQPRTNADQIKSWHRKHMAVLKRMLAGLSQSSIAVSPTEAEE